MSRGQERQEREERQEEERRGRKEEKGRAEEGKSKKAKKAKKKRNNKTGGESFFCRLVSVIGCLGKGLPGGVFDCHTRAKPGLDGRELRISPTSEALHHKLYQA